MKKKILIFTLLMIVFTIGCTNKMDNTLHVDEFSKIEYDEALNLDDYILSIKEQSNILKNSLENDELAQVDMNMKSQELYRLWDDALNYLWSKLKNSLPEEELEKLQIEQRIWIEEKEKTIEEAGKEFEGGSIYSLVVNGEAVKLTEERVYELYNLLKK